jgi:hypothetical protein
LISRLLNSTQWASSAAEVTFEAAEVEVDFEEAEGVAADETSTQDLQTASSVSYFWLN